MWAVGLWAVGRKIVSGGPLAVGRRIDEGCERGDCER